MRAVLAVLVMFLPLPAVAQVLPLPPAEREMSTDRPDKTESPYTVPKGRIQIELDGANYTRDRDQGFRVETIGVAPFNLKLGLNDTTDLQLVIAPYIHQVVTDVGNGVRAKTGGFGDVTVRLKHNLWGNDSGKTSFALMPFLTLPTSRADLGTSKIEFGLIAPMAIAVSDAIDLGLMTEIDVAADDRGGRRANFVNSATLGFALTGRWGIYTELYTERADRWIVTGDLGFTYAVSADVQIDTGINLGLNRAADDVGIFVGLSRRF